VYWEFESLLLGIALRLMRRFSREDKMEGQAERKADSVQKEVTLAFLVVEKSVKGGQERVKMVGRVNCLYLPPPPIKVNMPKVLMLSKSKKERRGGEKGAPTVGIFNVRVGGY